MFDLISNFFVNHYQWLFSGVGVSVILFFVQKHKTAAVKSHQNVKNIQSNGNVTINQVKDSSNINFVNPELKKKTSKLILTSSGMSRVGNENAKFTYVVKIENLGNTVTDINISSPDIGFSIQPEQIKYIKNDSRTIVSLVFIGTTFKPIQLCISYIDEFGESIQEFYKLEKKDHSIGEIYRVKN